MILRFSKKVLKIGSLFFLLASVLLFLLHAGMGKIDALYCWKGAVDRVDEQIVPTTDFNDMRNEFFCNVSLPITFILNNLGMHTPSDKFVNLGVWEYKNVSHSEWATNCTQQQFNETFYNDTSGQYEWYWKTNYTCSPYQVENWYYDFIPMSPPYGIGANEKRTYKFVFEVPNNATGKFFIYANTSEGNDEIDPYWNTSWKYGVNYTVKETAGYDRIYEPIGGGGIRINFTALAPGNEPIDCRKEIRVVDEDGTELVSGYQAMVWNETYSSGICEEANVIILANISANSQKNYTIYWNNTNAALPNSYNGGILRFTGTTNKVEVEGNELLFMIYNSTDKGAVFNITHKNIPVSQGGDFSHGVSGTSTYYCIGGNYQAPYITGSVDWKADDNYGSFAITTSKNQNCPVANANFEQRSIFFKLGKYRVIMQGFGGGEYNHTYAGHYRGDGINNPDNTRLGGGTVHDYSSYISSNNTIPAEDRLNMTISYWDDALNYSGTFGVVKRSVNFRNLTGFRNTNPTTGNWLALGFEDTDTDYPMRGNVTILHIYDDCTTSGCNEQASMDNMMKIQQPLVTTQGSLQAAPEVPTISLTFNFSSMDFGTVDENTVNNPAENNFGISVSTSGGCSGQVVFMPMSPVLTYNEFTIGNDNFKFNYSGAVGNSTLQVISVNRTVSISSGVLEPWYYLDVPSGKHAGTYNGTHHIEGRCA